MDQNVLSTQDEDWFWIKNFQEGDQSGFEQIFNKYKILVINLAFRFVRNRAIAEDIAQEVFIKIYEKKVLAKTGVKFSTWLYRVTVNAALDVVRKKRFLIQSLDEKKDSQTNDESPLIEKLTDSSYASPRENLEEEELKTMVRQEVQKLPEPLRLVMLLFQFENLSYREISEVLGISEKAVEKRIYHAKERLRKKLSKHLI